jgi:uncharacterized protein YacL
MEERYAARKRTGIIVGLILTVLTVGEYFMIGQIAILSVIAVAKGVLILYFFMHVSQIWDGGGHH